MRTISIKDLFFERYKYECKHDWPENCFIQGGDKGIVFNSSAAEAFEKPVETVLTTIGVTNDILPQKTKEYYTTCFFEAFPREPDTFLRGEGATMEEAETKCWEDYQKVVNCKSHEPERRNRRDGYGFCKHCGMGGMFFEPLETCKICGVPTYAFSDTDNNWYCKAHESAIPEDKQSTMYKSYLRLTQMDKESKNEPE